MTQETYNLIVKVIQNGAPALANDLLNAFNEVVQENIEMHQKIREFEKGGE